MKLRSNSISTTRRIRGYTVIVVGGTAAIAGTAAVTAGTVAAGVSLAATAYGAYSSSSASSAAAQGAAGQNAAIAAQAQGQQAALQELYKKQKDPTKIYNKEFTEFPNLLNSVLPSLTSMANTTAKKETASNIDTYEQAIKSLFPGFHGLQDRTLSVINSEDPANLGRQQLSEVAKLISPYIATGSVNPRNGQVGNGLASPDQLYRNAISGTYQQTLQRFLGDANTYLGNAENVAVRQQVQAPQFLSNFLNLDANTSANVTQLTLQQQQQNIAAQTQLMGSILQQPRATYDPAPALAQQASAIKSGVNTLAGAFGNQGGPVSYAPSGNIATNPNFGSGNSSFGYNPTSAMGYGAVG